MKTKVFLDEFKGNKVFAVWEVDDQGKKVGDYPLFSLGARKALALANHLEDFKDYVDTSRVELERKGRK
jgi:hypothetical protein